MPALYCHNCQQQFTVPANAGECPACGGGFVEEVPDQVRAVGPAAGQASSSHEAIDCVVTLQCM